MNTKIKGILLNLIIGDALGTPLDGLGKAHITATLKEINNYVDPSPALKDKINIWKKPGLYSSISQLMLIFALSFTKKGFSINNFIHNIENSPEITDNKFGVFRHPGQVENRFINKIKNKITNNGTIMHSCSRIIPIITPLSFNNPVMPQHLIDTISVVKEFTKDLCTISGALLFSLFINKLSTGKTKNIIDLAIELNNDIISTVESNSPIIFNSGLNPVSMIACCKRYTEIFKRINNEKDRGKAEEIIYSNLNKTLKSPVTRATVNNPLAIIPYALFLSRTYADNPSTMLFKVVQEGGSTSVLASMSGTILGSIYGVEYTPEILIQNLINRKRIIAIIDSIEKKNISEPLVNDFLKSEASLTIKEIQEFNAKQKHVKLKTKKQKSRKDKEMELSKHTIESWTKLDKAKWKKERKKLNKYKNI